MSEVRHGMMPFNTAIHTHTLTQLLLFTLPQHAEAVVVTEATVELVLGPAPFGLSESQSQQIRSGETMVHC